MKYGRRIKERLELLRLNETELAKAIHVSQTTVWRTVNDKIKQPKYIVEIAFALGTTPERLAMPVGSPWNDGERDEPALKTFTSASPSSINYLVRNEFKSLPNFPETTRFLVVPWDEDAMVNAKFILFRKQGSKRAEILQCHFFGDDIYVSSPSPLDPPVTDPADDDRLLIVDRGEILGAIFDVFSDSSFWRS